MVKDEKTTTKSSSPKKAIKIIKAGLIVTGTALASLYVYGNIKLAVNESREKKETERRRKREECRDLELLDLDIMEDLDDDWD